MPRAAASASQAATPPRPYEAGTPTVRHTLDPHTRELGPTKTERSRRTIYLPATAITALHEQRPRTGKWDRFVFATTTGTAMDARNVVRQYHAARKRLGLPNVPWHQLRHFAATALIEAGEDLFVVSRILGHTSVATTAGFYGHVRPAMLRQSADRMDEAMRKAAGT